MNVLHIYAGSAFRILSFVPLLAPTAILLVCTAADVLHWLIQPGRGYKGGIAEECRARFNTAFHAAQQESGPTTIVAYSQGSVIALDALRQANRHAKLVTIGSPINSVYWQFLGVKLDLNHEYVTWINFYRGSDYIGGSMPWSRNDFRIDEHQV